IPTSRIVAFCKQQYHDDQLPRSPLWRKRFVEDLVQVMGEMGSPLADAVDLELRDPGTGARSVQKNVPLTKDNRQRSWRDNNRAAFQSLRLRGWTPEVQLGSAWFELTSVDGVPRDKLVGLCRDVLGDRSER